MVPYALKLLGGFLFFFGVGASLLPVRPPRPLAEAWPRIGLWAAIALILTIVVAPAWAADAAADGRITIPVGDLIDQLVVPLFAGLAGVVTWLIRKLPAAAKAWIDTLRVEQLLDKAIAYGINSVAGAAKSKTLTIDVHLPVLAYVLQYALDRIPAALLRWVGGPTSLAEMIWSRLDVDVKATRPDLRTLAEEIAAGSSVAVAVSAVRDGVL